jgi:CheY-like chemotaxis protein
MTTVLLIEDDVDVRDAIAEVLSDVGYAVVSAANGRLALDLLTGGTKPDVIVLDLMMPEMDGREFRKRQLADAALSTIPIVVITADGRAPPTDLGVAGVLKKPFAPGALLSAIEGAVQGR